MPSTTPAQARLMAMIAHGGKAKAKVPLSVARDFNRADKKTGILRKKKPRTDGDIARSR